MQNVQNYAKTHYAKSIKLCERLKRFSRMFKIILECSIFLECSFLTKLWNKNKKKKIQRCRSASSLSSRLKMKGFTDLNSWGVIIDPVFPTLPWQVAKFNATNTRKSAVTFILSIERFKPYWKDIYNFLGYYMHVENVENMFWRSPEAHTARCRLWFIFW